MNARSDKISVFDSRSSFLARHGDAIFRGGLLFAVGAVTLLIVALPGVLIYRALPRLQQFGFGFLTGRSWNPAHGDFGALPLIYGTLITSAVALLIAVPLALGVAIFLTEQSSTRFARPLAFLVELLATIPSVIYGLWGIFVLAPFIRNYFSGGLNATPGWTLLFSGTPTGIDMLTAGIILALMITPVIALIVRDVLAAVPLAQREAALALGATRWEATRVVLATAGAGIAGAVLLGLSRAIGETIAVAIIIGSRLQNAAASFEPAGTLASVLASGFDATTDRLYLSALIEIALLLLLITFVINGCAKLLVWRVRSNALKNADGRITP